MTQRRKLVADAMRDRVLTGLHTGLVRDGERLPGVRALAAEFAVNERVVLAALRALADEGLVELRPRSGAYVLPQHGSADGPLPYLGSWAVDVLLQAQSRGLAPASVAGLLRRSLGARPVRAACIECNADQLHLLTSELAQRYGYAVTPVELDALSGATRFLRDVDVFVTTVFHANVVKRVANRAGKPWIAVSLHPAALRDVVRALRAAPVYYIATDPRFETKLRHMLAPLADASRLQVRIIGRDPLNDIPPDAVTVVMTSARAVAQSGSGAWRGPGRPLLMSRQFSDESARDLLSFIVRSNLAGA